MIQGISDEKYEDVENIKNQTAAVVTELLESANLEKGDILVVGCSSSEVAHRKIGTFSSEEIGRLIFETIKSVTDRFGLYIAAQCCEHLNRALVIEKEAAKAYGLEVVCVVPQLKAGGSFATAAYHGFEKPVVVEEVKAAAGIDIGDTLIGMHLKSVAVPVRVKQDKIGDAHVVCARTRAKYIGGERAVYQ